MRYAVWIALAVGGTTMLGGAIGFLIRVRSEKTEGRIFAFAGGVMLAASVADLILPALEGKSGASLAVCLVSVLLGGALITLMSGVVPFLERRLLDGRTGGKRFRAALLFVLAIAMHNLPEGLACGAALGTGDLAVAASLTLGIAVQNVPEGMIVIPPLTAAGVRRTRALLASVLTGVIEIVGVFLGYFTSRLALTLMPYILCLTGGAMSYIICTDVLNTPRDPVGRGYAFLLGMCLLFLLLCVF